MQNTSRHAARWVVAALAGLLLAGCRREAAIPTPPPPSPVIATRTSPPFPTATTEATPTPSPTATATPLPPPGLVVEPQVLTIEGRLVVAQVVAPRGAWLAIHAQAADGPVLAAQLLPAGVSEAVGVTIDPYAAAETMVAVLHQDAGAVGTFEWPGVDAPLVAGDGLAEQAFTVDIQVPQPSLIAADQAVGDDGLVRAEEVVTPGPGWLAVYTDRDGAPGPLLGYAPLPAGLSRDVVVRINWRAGTPILWIAVLRDAGELGVFTADEPAIVVGGAPVATSVRVTYPPDVIILDQPVVDGQIQVERVIADGPGWLVLYADADGQPGTIVGFGALADGLNERFPIAVSGDLTPVLHARLHQDAGEVGVFEVPGADQPILGPDRRIPGFSFRTDQGPVLIGSDQAVSETVVAPLLVAGVDMWLVARAEVDGGPGPIVGRVRLAAGMHWDAPVPVDAEALTPTIYLQLIEDAGVINLFEYPDGPDEPLLVGRSPVIVPVRVLEP